MAGGALEEMIAKARESASPSQALAEARQRLTSIVSEGKADEHGGLVMAKIQDTYKKKYKSRLDAPACGFAKLSLLLESMEELVVDYCGPGTKSIVRLAGTGANVTPKPAKPAKKAKAARGAKLKAAAAAPEEKAQANGVRPKPSPRANGAAQTPRTWGSADASAERVRAPKPAAAAPPPVETAEEEPLWGSHPAQPSRSSGWDSPPAGGGPAAAASAAAAAAEPR